MKLNQRAVIEIPFSYFDHFTDEMLEVTRDWLVIEATNHFSTQSTTYHVVSSHFKETKNGLIIPVYELSREFDRGKIRYWLLGEGQKLVIWRGEDK